jgi:hypothetical protein
MQQSVSNFEILKKKNLNSKYDHILRTNEDILKQITTLYLV